MSLRRIWLTLSGVVFVLLAAGADSCGTDTGGSNGKDAKSAGGDKECGITATDDCTPRVGPNGKVRVDALIWRVTGTQTAATLGDTSLGIGAKADGTFVIVSVKVTSRKNESATLTDEAIQLQVGQNTYKADSDGTTAAIGAGQNPLFLEDIGPDAKLQSKVVFDLPSAVLKRKIYVRFNELGFGSAHGFIRLPTPSPAG